MSNEFPPDLTNILPAPFEWCHIEGGVVILRDASQDWPFIGTRGGTISVSTFYIGKFAITNQQYQTFIEDGYDDLSWWDFSNEAILWRKANLCSLPIRYVGDLLPRQLAWFDAVAFTRWLSYKAGGFISLPTEEQWQRAALGDQPWQYPYGPAFENRKANIASSYINQPNPVTQYHEGISSFGVYDMSGNVFQWCLNQWETGDTALHGKTDRVIRGGDYMHNEFPASARARSCRPPDNTLQGLRIVCNNV